jgi:hypothetical protein
MPLASGWPQQKQNPSTPPPNLNKSSRCAFRCQVRLIHTIQEPQTQRLLARRTSNESLWLGQFEDWTSERGVSNGVTHSTVMQSLTIFSSMGVNQTFSTLSSLSRGQISNLRHSRRLPKGNWLHNRFSTRRASQTTRLGHERNLIYSKRHLL